MVTHFIVLGKNSNVGAQCFIMIMIRYHVRIKQNDNSNSYIQVAKER